jgi:uncharacterized protein
MLIGRQKEKELLDSLLASKKAEFVAVYGRRRVGKTYLIRQYLKNELIFDFSGSNDENNAVQIANFTREFGRQCVDNEILPKDWSEAFALLSDYLYTLDTQKKVVVFIDELPWLDKAKSGFLPALEYFWNQHGSQMDHLLFITCGSTSSWIINKLLNAYGGLHNRVTQNIELKPFTLNETEEFLKYKNLKFTKYQIVQLYMAMGGVPFYLQAIKQGKSVNQVIEDLCFDKGGLLSKEFMPLYHSLFKKAKIHIAIITALAKHPYGLSRGKLLEKVNLSVGGGLMRAMDNLIDSGFVKKIEPFGKKNREAVFRVIDFYSIFYLRFIEGNVTDRKNTWQSMADSPNYVSWCGYAFENICFAHLPQIHRSLGIEGVTTKVSSWKAEGNADMPGAQIDLVIDRKDGIINLCEAKFSNTEFVLTKEYTAKLRQKRAVFEYFTKTKKSVVSTLLSTYPAIKNEYYSEEIHSEIQMEDLFVKI